MMASDQVEAQAALLLPAPTASCMLLFSNTATANAINSHDT